MKKINKQSLKEFNKLKNQYKYYVATSYEDFDDTIDVNIYFSNNTEIFDDYLNLEFTPKFFKNKFKPEFLPSDDIFETYQCKEENFGWNPHHEEPWDKFGKEHTDFESENGRKMNMEPESKDVISDVEAGIKMTRNGNSMSWNLEFINSKPLLPLLYDMTCELDLIMDETLPETFFENDFYQECYFKAVNNFLSEYRDEFEELGTPKQIQLIHVFHNVFGNEEAKEFYMSHENETQKELKNSILLVYKALEDKGVVNNLLDYEIESKISRSPFLNLRSLAITIKDKETGEYI